MEARYQASALPRRLGAVWEKRWRAPQLPDGAGRRHALGVLGWALYWHASHDQLHAAARQTRRGGPVRHDGIKKAPDTCPGASSELASPAMAHELYLNPLVSEGSQAWQRPYHIRALPHKPRRLRISPATKTRQRCAGSKPACRRPIP